MHRSLYTTISFVAVACAIAPGCSKVSSSGSGPQGSASAVASATASSIPAPPDVGAIPADAQRLASGIAFKILKKGTGDKNPQVQDTVSVHYTGWNTEGQMLDSSVLRGQPVTFQIRGAVPGWSESLQHMVVGEKRRLWIPAELASKGGPGGSPQGIVVFEMELLTITEGPKPIPAPADVASPPADAIKDKSGIKSKVLEQGKGTKHPKDQDTVKFNFTAWTADGQMLDSSIARNQPATSPLGHMPPGWSDALALMSEGEKRRVWIPEEMAFQGKPGSPKGALCMEVELVSITDGPKPIPAPADVAKPPADAKKTASGLYSKVISKGKGTVHPTASSTVEVDYTGWTTNGKMFDSSVVSKQPAKFPLSGVIPGWTEGVQLMVEGEKRRFWIPEELAYKDKPGAPQGMLVFDIELKQILKDTPGKRPGMQGRPTRQ